LQAALTQRKRERDAEKQVAAAGKDRRQWQRTREAVPASDGKTSSKGEVEEEEENAEGDEAAAQSNEDMDLLPDSVIQAMAEAEANDRRLMERRIVTKELRAALQRAPKARQRRTFKKRDVGPVTVKVLNSVGGRQASKAAKAFLHERLHAGVQRSNGMLQPSKIGGMFVYGPKV